MTEQGLLFQQESKWMLQIKNRIIGRKDRGQKEDDDIHIWRRLDSKKNSLSLK